MKMLISRKFSFDAAHFLPSYEGKCHNMHGHSWQVEIKIGGVVNSTSGMIMDFSVLKKLVEPLLEELDHHTLNDVAGLGNPTAENLCAWFWVHLEGLVRVSTKDFGRLASIKVWESKDSYAEVRSE